MLAMSRTGSERGTTTATAGTWKDTSYHRCSADSSVESSEDSDNSSTNSSLNGGSKSNGSGGLGGNGNTGNGNSTSHLQPPIGCITTHRVSAVIRPERKMPPIDPLQFVKIQKNELSQKAVEQIKLAEEVKITKEKIKEVEEEWQNNLMNWKSKRKLTKNNSEDEIMPRNPNRRTKTFTEILNEKAKSGARIGYNLHKYIDPDLEENNNMDFLKVDNDDGNDDDDDDDVGDGMSNPNQHQFPEQQQAQEQTSNANNNMDSDTTNLNRYLNVDCGGGEIDKPVRNGLGEVAVFDTSLLQEFSVKATDHCDNNNNNDADNDGRQEDSNQFMMMESKFSSLNLATETGSSRQQTNNQRQSSTAMSPQKVHVPINDWKSSSHSPSQQQQQQSISSRKPQSVSPDHHDTQQRQQQQQQQNNSSFEIDDDEELLDEKELEELRMKQERSFKAKLQTFESLAKQEEEAARRAAEANRRRQQNRAKLAAERSKSLSNINNLQSKNVLTASNSVSSSSLQNSVKNKPSLEDQTSGKKSDDQQQPYYSFANNSPSNSIVYNFKDKPENSISGNNSNVGVSQQQPVKKNIQQQPQKKTVTSASALAEAASATAKNPSPQTVTNNIYENVTNLTATPTTTTTATPIIHHQQQQPAAAKIIPGSHHNHHQNLLMESPGEIMADSDAIRNASQKLLQQQQQIYQNQPMAVQQPFKNQYDHYSNLASSSFVGGYPVPDDAVGLPPIQITKSVQSEQQQHLIEHPVYQNQQMIQSGYHTYENSFPTPEPSIPIMMRPEEIMMVSGSLDDGHYPDPDPVGSISSYHSQPSPIMYHHRNNPYIPDSSSQMFYHPKQPYGAASGQKPLAKQQLPPTRIPANPNRYGANGYNPNHWLIQEAELRQSTQRAAMKAASGVTQQQQPPVAPVPSKNGGPGSGFLSVSGKKKCSKCGDELGKGCAAMVVESLSLYYHINCFRCSVCNVQLGNGTVGTDVRVRNNKLHCQNCYSNDEAGLKFSRV